MKEFKPGDTVRWFRGTSGVVLEGVLLRLVPTDAYPTPLWEARATRTLPPGEPWPGDTGEVWYVTEAEMRFEAVRPLRSLEDAGLKRPVFDEAGNMIASWGPSLIRPLLRLAAWRAAAGIGPRHSDQGETEMKNEFFLLCRSDGTYLTDDFETWSSDIEKAHRFIRGAALNQCRRAVARIGDTRRRGARSRGGGVVRVTRRDLVPALLVLFGVGIALLGAAWLAAPRACASRITDAGRHYIDHPEERRKESK